VRILLVDDHELFRRGLQLLLEPLDPAIEFEEASTLDEALKFARAPIDLVLLDLKLRGASGLPAFRMAKAAFEAVPVVVLSGEENPAAIAEVIEAGAAGFIPKSTSPESMREALRRVLAGGFHLPEPLMQRLDAEGATTPSRSRFAAMSGRQREVLLRAVQGKPNKVIARELQLSEGTVKAHLSAAYRVLGVNNRVKALIAVAREGVSSLER
jgi:DNA-binding NarL/FixJ family response regulator